MTTRSRIVALALSTTVSFALTACGGSSEADTVKAAIKADVIKTQKSKTDDPLKMTPDQAGCFSGKIVDQVGVDGLRKDGIIGKDDKVTKALSSSDLHLPKDHATTFVNALFDCENGGATVVTAFRKKMDESMTTLPAAAKTCIENKIDAGLIKQILLATLSGQGKDALRSQVTQIAQGCVTGAQ